MGWERSGKEGDQNTDQDGNAVGKDSDWDRNVLGNALGKSRGEDRSARAPRHDTRRIPVRNWELYNWGSWRVEPSTDGIRAGRDGHRDSHLPSASRDPWSFPAEPLLIPSLLILGHQRNLNWCPVSPRGVTTGSSPKNKPCKTLRGLDSFFQLV